MPPVQTAHLRLEFLSDASAVLWFDVADRPVNVFTLPLLADLEMALTQLANDQTCRLLVLRSAKPNGFLYGADIQEFTRIRTPEQAAELSARGQRLFDQLAHLPQTTIAVIHGPCLGGGLECALACDYRLVVDQPKTQLALPEIKLGLVPAWGGTQRLPRVVGLEAALRIILGQKTLNARQARQWGLADALATPDELESALDRLAQIARSRGKQRRQRLPLHTWRQRLLESHPLGRWLILRGSERLLRERVPEDMPAPWEALAAVRVGVQQGFAPGLAAERAAVSRLATTPACRNLVTLFFLKEHATKAPSSPGDTALRRIGVVGAGTMGAGIAQLAALKGYEVVVQEVNEAALAAGLRRIDDLFGKAVANGILSADDAAQKRAAIRQTTTWQGFDQVDLVIEAVIEDLNIKRSVFRELEQRTRPTTLLATNTSSLLVAHLQEGRQQPQRMGGLHFFNPVHKMPLVEVVRGPLTDDPTTATLRYFASALGKVPVVVQDSPGFLVNRILMPYLNEAVLLMQDARWSASAIDRLMVQFGMPVGPLQLLDQVGLDVAAHVERSMRPAFAARFEPNPCFQRMCERGWLGEKSGTGFYRYQGKKRRPHDNVRGVFREENTVRPISADPRSGRVDLGDARTRDRLVLLMVNEAAMCLGEGIAADAATIDLAMVFGTGWAPHRGGPLRYADDRGLVNVMHVLAGLAKSHGPRFEPCAELRRRAERGELFYPPAWRGSDGSGLPLLFQAGTGDA